VEDLLAVIRLKVSGNRLSIFPSTPQVFEWKRAQPRRRADRARRKTLPDTCTRWPSRVVLCPTTVEVASLTGGLASQCAKGVPSAPCGTRLHGVLATERQGRVGLQADPLKGPLRRGVSCRQGITCRPRAPHDCLRRSRLWSVRLKWPSRGRRASPRTSLPGPWEPHNLPPNNRLSVRRPPSGAPATLSRHPLRGS